MILIRSLHPWTDVEAYLGFSLKIEIRDMYRKYVCVMLLLHKCEQFAWDEAVLAKKNYKSAYRKWLYSSDRYDKSKD